MREAYDMRTPDADYYADLYKDQLASLPKGVQAALLDSLLRTGITTALATAMSHLPNILFLNKIDPLAFEEYLKMYGERRDETIPLDELDIEEMSC